MLYQAYQFQEDMIAPMRGFADDTELLRARDVAMGVVGQLAGA